MSDKYYSKVSMGIAFDKPEQHPEEVYGTFRLGSNEFGVCASFIREVINAPAEYRPNPLCPSYIIGTLTLRDTIIPVVDLERLFTRQVKTTQHSGVDNKNGKVAIIDMNHQPIGFLFDDTIDVFRSNSPDCEFVDVANVDESGATRGAFWFSSADRVVQVLDPLQILQANDALPHLANDEARVEERKLVHRGPLCRSIAFRVGPLQMAFDMADVEEVLPSTEVLRDDIASGVLLGALKLRGEEIPLIDLAAVFHIQATDGSLQLCDKSIVVVDHASMRFGLVVDEINDLLQYYTDELLAYPGFAIGSPDLFAGCVKNKAGEERILLSIDGLFDTPEMQSAVQTSDDFFDKHSGNEEASRVIQTGELTSYLTFDIDGLYALPLSKIVEVVDYPTELVQPPMLNELFDGVLNLRGEFIATMSVQSLYQLDADLHKHQHIIVFEHDGQQYGLAVPSVTSIIHIDLANQHALPAVLQQDIENLAEDVEKSILLGLDDEEPSVSLSIIDLAKIATRAQKVKNQM
ncbi:MAG: chemotaxis protein CheW [Pseudomonadales bacterium]